MDYTSNNLDLCHRRIAEDHKRILDQEADIRGILLRGESRGLAEEKLIDLNRILRADVFDRDLIVAAIKLDQH